MLEERSARYMGVTTTLGDAVELTLSNVPAEITAHSVQIHPQRPELGKRVMRRFNKVLIDQADALTFKASQSPDIRCQMSVLILDGRSARR